MDRQDSVSNRPWHIELQGIDPIPDSERHGQIQDLFWIWFAGNLGLLGVVYGAMLFSFGLNFWQSLLAIIVGSLSFLLVGSFSVAGRDGGVPMMTLSRSVFGIYGNVLPNLVSWISLVGWETITVIIGTLALMVLFGDGGRVQSDISAGISLLIMVGASIVAGLLGQATLVIIQKWASYVFGILTLAVTGLLLSHTDWAHVFHHPEGPWITGFVPAVSIIIAGTGLSWTNTAADYSRYLPRSASARRIVATSTLGAFIPLVFLMGVGMLAATTEPQLPTALNPLTVLGREMPSWMTVPYFLTAAGGLVVEADLSLYSSGLNLLNLFVPFARYQTVMLDAVIMVTGTIYIVFIAKNFLVSFEAFVVLLGVGLAAWAGIFLAYQLVVYVHRLPLYRDDADLHLIEWPATFIWIISVGVGLLFTSSPWFSGPFAQGIFAHSNLEILMTFVISLLGYGLWSWKSSFTRDTDG
ncbi:purine-cytosine permease family protein [Sulfobacillus thermosulfidooxidans]|uniref:purine-cytosine permease family protein n=1 Tax=Sulfobacillus thermosulfidooxidans TaxID=28034 RepID=UPI0006B5BDFF|nr:cytosine permease [Sulfobacillus thermosulfidooxidans]